MKLIIQRVSSAQVSVDGQIIGAIKSGLVILFGAAKGDTYEQAELLAHKVAELRIFADQLDKMNLNILQSGGEILSISQFTLLADTSKGHRPNFIQAAKPETAIALYNHFNQQLTSLGIKIATGQFGAKMLLTLTNDGPVTISLES